MAGPNRTGRFSLREPNHRPARFATPQGWGEMGHNDPATSWLKPWPNARNRRRSTAGARCNRRLLQHFRNLTLSIGCANTQL
ncbi:hypothetical protein [Azospirillum palustre]